MQKINVATIVAWHLDTLRRDDRLLSRIDLLTFYGLPAALALGFFILDWRIPKDAFELAVTAFSIFAALLLSVQVALYTVSLRPLQQPDDPKKMTAYKTRAATRKTLLRELNDNIAYLILLSVVSVTLLLALFVTDSRGRLPSAIVFAMFVHFFLTLLMVVKRASIVFSREYEAVASDDTNQPTQASSEKKTSQG